MAKRLEGSAQHRQVTAALAAAKAQLKADEAEVARLAAEAERALAEHKDFKERLKPVAGPAAYLLGELTRLDSAARSAIHRKQKAEAELGPVKAGIADLEKALRQLGKMGL
jgi:hypothetical protein